MKTLVPKMDFTNNQKESFLAHVEREDIVRLWMLLSSVIPARDMSTKLDSWTYRYLRRLSTAQIAELLCDTPTAIRAYTTEANKSLARVYIEKVIDPILLEGADPVILLRERNAYCDKAAKWCMFPSSVECLRELCNACDPTHLLELFSGTALTSIPVEIYTLRFVGGVSVKDIADTYHISVVNAEYLIYGVFEAAARILG
ncbi:MAG: hypothetical protein NC548_28625 [Lachnospiraceae bacterium]|nr:hypothetical protein [Lachnospiraceae bacterium]